MKVLLTNPPWIISKSLAGMRLSKHWPFFRMVYKGQEGVRAGSRWPFLVPINDSYKPYPFFLGYAASYLLSKGIDAVFYDALTLRHSEDRFFKTAEKIKPDIVIIETSTPSFTVDLSIAEKLSKNADICLTGPHATVFAEELINRPYIKYILKGEYELSSYEMVCTLRPGIYDYNQVENLDTLPYPYRDREYAYLYWDGVLPGTKKPQLQMYASRGCPFSCTFCMWTHVMYRNRYRQRKPSSVLAEIKHCLEKFPKYRDIFFDDDTFNIGKERVVELARGLKEIGIPFSIMGRADTLPLETYKTIVESGCHGIRIGVETFSPKLSRKINKQEDPEKIIETLKYLKTLPVDLHLTSMSNIPAEMPEDRAYSEKIFNAIGIQRQISQCIPFPGTPYYEELKAKGMDMEYWDAYSGDGNNVITGEFLNKCQKILSS